MVADASKSDVIISHVKPNQNGKLGEKTGSDFASPTVNNNVDEKIQLKREIGLLEAIAITVGSIIGSGIFISPKGIVQHVGSIGASLVIWVVCGVLSLMGRFCYAELGTMFPSAGGAYTYIYESFGPAPAFMYLWVNNVIGTPLSNAILGLTFSKYVVQPFFPIGCLIPGLAVRLLSAAAIMLITVINSMSVRQVGKIINVFMYLKIFALGLIVLAGVYVVSSGQQNVENVENIWTGKFTAETIVYSIFSGMFAFGGWQSMPAMMEELKEPVKNLPLAIFSSIAIVTLIYVLANVAYFTVLTPKEMISSDAVAVTFIGKFWGYLVGVVPIFVAFSIFGSLSAHIMTSARFCYVAARCGQFPSALGLISVSHHTPISSVIIMSFMTIFFLYTSDLFALINLLAIMNNLFPVVVYSTSIYFRWKRPDIHRPFKIPILLPILNITVSLLFFLIPVWVQPVNAATSVLLILPGIPVYYFIVAPGKIPPWIRKFDVMMRRQFTYLSRMEYDNCSKVTNGSEGGVSESFTASFFTAFTYDMIFTV